MTQMKIEPNPLKEKYYGQMSEEEIINRYIGKDPNKEKGRYIDIGAGDPITYSNTYYYWLRNWKGILVEPNPKYHKKIKKERPNDALLPIAITNYNGEVEMVETITIDSPLGEHRKNKKLKKNFFTVDAMTINTLIHKYPTFAEPDLLSLDVETNEEKVLSQCDFRRFRPTVICIEFLCPGKDENGEWQERIDYRPKWEKYLLPYYIPVETRGGNAIYVRKDKWKGIPQYEPVFGDNERTALNNYMMTGGWITEYKKTREFERRIADYLKVKHCIAVNNGTISLSLALLAHGIKPGDRVLVPSLTMIATANAVKLIGAKPVFVDVESETLCMDLEKAKEYLQNPLNKTIKAVIYVSLNGRRKISDFLTNEGITTIEDNAQAFGSKTKSRKMIGNSDVISSFSFSMPKIISTGQGGCLTTNDDELANRLRELKDFGRAEGGIDIHNTFGINSKFTDIQAVIGISQMLQIDYRVKRKKDIYQLYWDNLQDIEEIEFLPTDLSIVVPWFVDIYTHRREELIAYLDENKIGTRRMYPPIYSQKCYNHILQVKHRTAEHYSARGLWLPCSFDLRNEEIVLICDKIKKFFEKGRKK